MTLTASQMFHFLDTTTTFSLERVEFAHTEFNNLRRSLRGIIRMLNDSDEQDAKDLSDGLRMTVSEWLTSPIRFDLQTMWGVVDSMGTESHVRQRWGLDLFNLYNSAAEAALKLSEATNPLRDQLQSTIRQLIAEGVKFKIYCHRRARPLFEAMYQEGNRPENFSSSFLYSVRDYRESEIFDTLIKVGPLRSRGWGAVPDALLNAPRFKRIVQFVWSGCQDEPGFGSDTGIITENSDSPSKIEATASNILVVDTITWQKSLFQHGAELRGIGAEYSDLDELREFSQQAAISSRPRNAVLVQIDDEHGILYPRFSKVISFDPNALDSDHVALRIPGESLLEGMFLIRPLLADDNLSSLTSEQGIYSQRWKLQLQRALSGNVENLVVRLRTSGLNLIGLEHALRRWSKPQTTVIHAPQQRTHFEILLRALELGNEAIQVEKKPRVLYSKLAWNEICHSRGEAIQAGVQEHEQLENLSLAILKGLRTPITELARENVTFQLDIPLDSSVSGHFHIYKIQGIEEGYSAPDGEIKVIRELRQIDQWRV